MSSNTPPPTPSPDAQASSNWSAGGRRWLLVDGGLSCLWLLNIALLLGIVAWIAIDPVVSRHLAAKEIDFTPLMTASGARIVDPVAPEGYHARLITLVGGLAVASLLAIAGGLILGPSRHRRLRSWLAFTAIVAGWLALGVSWRDLAWTGQRWRLGRQVAAVEPIAATLRARWPNNDGSDVPDLGAYMAYPQGTPRMLLLLTPARPAGLTSAITAVERSDAGGLRFELAGNDAGAWLEWHPPGKAPASFRGGLEVEYELLRASPIGEGWYLTRYWPSTMKPVP